jgi:hypothetical protein
MEGDEGVRRVWAEASEYLYQKSDDSLRAQSFIPRWLRVPPSMASSRRSPYSLPMPMEATGTRRRAPDPGGARRHGLAADRHGPGNSTTSRVGGLSEYQPVLWPRRATLLRHVCHMPNECPGMPPAKYRGPVARCGRNMTDSCSIAAGGFASLFAGSMCCIWLKC